MKCGTGVDLEKALADGEITQEDYDAVKTFEKFLKATPAEKAKMILSGELEES